MKIENLESPLKEQEICVKCGFCCDNTLFDHAHLDPGEKGTLPEEMEKGYVKIKDNEYFKLPCSYFDGKCTIYNQKKAHICGAFRCQLLKNFETGNIDQVHAFEVVRRTKETKSELLSEFKHLSGENSNLPFREMMQALGKKQKELAAVGIVSLEWEIFTAKCNIFETLLTKHFKSEENFQSMVSKDDKENDSMI